MTTLLHDINLGSAFAVKERFDEACAALRRGVALDDSCNDAKFNLALTLLAIGEFEEGWEFDDTRLRLPDKVRSPVQLRCGMEILLALVMSLYWSGLNRVLVIIFNLCVMYKYWLRLESGSRFRLVNL